MFYSLDENNLLPLSTIGLSLYFTGNVLDCVPLVVTYKPDMYLCLPFSVRRSYSNEGV